MGKIIAIANQKGGVGKTTTIGKMAYQFKKQGLNPIPAPAGFLVKTRPNQGYSFSFSGRDLQKSERAIHEYLGITWAKLRGLAD